MRSQISDIQIFPKKKGKLQKHDVILRKAAVVPEARPRCTCSVVTITNYLGN